MPNMTLAIPEDLQKIMRKHNKIRWSEVARMALWKQVEKLELMEKLDKLLEKSELTEEDTIELGRKIKKEIARRHRLRV